MTVRKTISLGSHFDKFVEQQISDGRYENISEVIRTGLRGLEDREAKFELLREQIREAEAQIDRGQSEAITDVDLFVSEFLNLKSGQRD